MNDLILLILVQSRTFVLKGKCECHILQLKPHNQKEFSLCVTHVMERQISEN